MPIDSKHPLYSANISAWKRCRDAYMGEDAVKASGKTYLPKPGGLSDSEYNVYTQRALFYEATGRTIDGFVGAISRKDPIVTVPAKLEPLLANITGDGLTLGELVKQLAGETILQGRLGILCDFDEARQASYLTTYQVESITNWADGLVVLNETVYEPDPEDRFKVIPVEQYRQLWLNEGVYTVTVWRKSTHASQIAVEWVAGPDVVPLRRGKALDFIPFFWVTPVGKTQRIEKPPLLGLVNVCMSHYMNSADLEWGRHFTGLPTLYVTGVQSDIPINVGSTAAIVLPDANSKVAYAEFNGAGLSSLENALDEKEAKMAVLGAQVFVAEKKGVEAAQTARIRTSGETNLLTGVVTSVEETIQAALSCAAEWMGVTDKIEVTLSRDFVDTKLDGPTLAGLVQAYQSGALTIEQFLFNLQQGEMLAPDTDIETEAAAVAAAQQAKADQAIRNAMALKPTTTPNA